MTLSLDGAVYGASNKLMTINKSSGSMNATL